MYTHTHTWRKTEAHATHIGTAPHNFAQGSKRLHVGHGRPAVRGLVRKRLVVGGRRFRWRLLQDSACVLYVGMYVLYLHTSEEMQDVRRVCVCVSVCVCKCVRVTRNAGFT